MKSILVLSALCVTKMAFNFSVSFFASFIEKTTMAEEDETFVDFLESISDACIAMEQVNFIRVEPRLTSRRYLDTAGGRFQRS